MFRVYLENNQCASEKCLTCVKKMFIVNLKIGERIVKGKKSKKLIKRKYKRNHKTSRENHKKNEKNG